MRRLTGGNKATRRIGRSHHGDEQGYGDCRAPGGMASKDSNPNLPTQPEEIAESVYRSFKVGACIAALHAR